MKTGIFNVEGKSLNKDKFKQLNKNELPACPVRSIFDTRPRDMPVKSMRSTKKSK